MYEITVKKNPTKAKIFINGIPDFSLIPDYLISAISKEILTMGKRKFSKVQKEIKNDITSHNDI